MFALFPCFQICDLVEGLLTDWIECHRTSLSSSVFGGHHFARLRFVFLSHFVWIADIPTPPLLAGLPLGKRREGMESLRNRWDAAMVYGRPIFRSLTHREITFLPRNTSPLISLGYFQLFLVWSVAARPALGLFSLTSSRLVLPTACSCSFSSLACMHFVDSGLEYIMYTHFF